MKIKILTDEQAIKRVLFDKDIWNRVCNGVDFDSSNFEIPSDWIYLTETGNEVFVLSNTDHIHVNILAEARGDAYFKCLRFINWIKMNTDLDIIHLNIHKKHKNAIRLGLLCGFSEVEIKNDRHAMILRLER